MPVAFTSQVKSVQSQTVMMDSRIENKLRWRERAICNMPFFGGKGKGKGDEDEHPGNTNSPLSAKL